MMDWQSFFIGLSVGLLFGDWRSWIKARQYSYPHSTLADTLTSFFNGLKVDQEIGICLNVSRIENKDDGPGDDVVPADPLDHSYRNN